MEDMGLEAYGESYPADFISNLIIAEYKDFIAQLKSHKTEAAAEIDKILGEVGAALTEVGLAQTKAKGRGGKGLTLSCESPDDLANMSCRD